MFLKVGRHEPGYYLENQSDFQVQGWPVTKIKFSGVFFFLSSGAANNRCLQHVGREEILVLM